MLENVEVLFHSAIKFYFNNKIVYVDPYGLQESTKDAEKFKDMLNKKQNV